MNSRLKVIQSTEADNQLIFHTSKETMFEKSNPILSFGKKSQEVDIFFVENIKIDEIILSANIISELNIPLFGDYEVKIQSDQIIIGPYIGIIAYLKEKSLQARLRDLNSYVKNYDQIGGIVVAFSLDQVEPHCDYIKSGFIYDPENNIWEKCVNIPYPSSLFNKCKVKSNDQWDFLANLYRSNLYNFPTFDKWQMYSWLLEDPDLKVVLPSSKICRHPKDLLRYTKHYKQAYLKPIGGTFAKGIMKLSYRDKAVLVHYENKRKSVYKKLNNKLEFAKFFKRKLKRNVCLIQEAIPLLSVQDSIIDFRFIYIKNQYSKWENTGLFARYGKKMSMVSNLTRGGKSMDGEQVLLEFFSDDKVDEIIYQMGTISEKAVAILEKKLVHCGNLGFDFGVDCSGKVWIIEINNEDPDHRIASVCNRRDILYYTRLQNMLYTKKIAGFNEI